MSYRTLYVTLLTTVTLGFCQTLHAIDGDEVIDPSRGKEIAGSESSVTQGLLTGDSASSGALITLVGYAVVIGALGVTAWFLLKSGFMRKSFKKGDGKLKIAETRMLGNRQFISVVEYENQKILIGVGPGKIDYLTTLQNDSAAFPQIDTPVLEVEQGRRA